MFIKIVWESQFQPWLPRESNLGLPAWSHSGISFVLLSNRLDKMLAANTVIGYRTTNICEKNIKSIFFRKTKINLASISAENN